MSTNSSILNSIRKPLGSNKRLLGLVTFACIIIGLLAAGYYQHIQNNKTGIREYKLQTLDSDFDVMSKQFLNIMEVIASQGDTTVSERKKSIFKEIWGKWRKSKEAQKNHPEFDQFIIGLKGSPTQNEEVTLYISTLNGLDKIPEHLFDSIPFNIGLSTAIPNKVAEYQLFGKKYHFQGELKTDKEDEDKEINKDIDIDITLIGLVKSENYNENIRKLDPWIISLLTTFLLLCLFGLPYFKLIFIAEDERLSSKDVIWSGFALILGGPIVFIIFLSVNDYQRDYNLTTPSRLEKLGADIAADFHDENQNNISILSDSTLLLPDSAFENKTDSTPFYKRYTPVNDAVTESKEASIDSLLESFKFITKIEKNGKILFTVTMVAHPNDTKSKEDGSGGNDGSKKKNDSIKKLETLESRVYFKDFKDGKNVWVTQGDKEYVMRPVVSIQDRKEEAVYIIKDNKNYKVGSAQLKSVHAPILPFGYQFAIVDQKGDVWFHSEEGHSTLENIFAVSRQDGDLKAAIIGRVDAKGSFEYRDEPKLFYVSPIAGTNLNVITFYEIGLLRLKVSEVLTITSIAILIAFLVLTIITFLTLIIKNPKLGLYKYDPFLFEFLLPKKANKQAYILLSILFILILVIAIGVSYFFPKLFPIDVEPTLTYIFSLLIAIWSYIIVFYTLHPKSSRRQNKVNMRDLLRKINVRDLILLGVIVSLNKLMVDLHFTVKGNWLCATAIIIQLVIAYFIVIGGIRDSLPKQLKHLCKLNVVNELIAYRYWYSIFLFSWLVLASIFPAYQFFEKSKDLNDLIWYKADQKYMAQAYMEKETKLKALLKPSRGRKNFDLDAYLKTNGKYPKFIKFEEFQKSNEDDTHNEETQSAIIPDNLIFREFLWKTRPIYDEKVREFQALVYRHSLDDSWHSKENLKNPSFNLSDVAKNEGVSVSGYTQHWENEQNFTYASLYKWIGLLLILAMLFSLVLFFVDRFFGFRFRHLKPNDFDTNDEKEYAKKFADMLHLEESNFGLLLMGLPFSGKRDFANEIIRVSKYTKTATLSFLRLENLSAKATVPEIMQELVTEISQEKYSKSDWNDKEVFIIEHLEHNLKSLEANHLKLRLISYLMSEKKRVILISEVYPSQILSLYKSPTEKLSGIEGSLENDFNSWRNILSAFPQVLIGITKNRKTVRHTIKREIEALKIRMPNLSLGDIRKSVMPLVKELSHSKFLPSLAPIVLSKSQYKIENKLTLDLQRMVMHTQNLGHGYYNDIWNSLPARERYILYDLAKDGFLNIKNRNSLFSLMKKGLIVWKDRPRIFNYSFRNFIITSVSLNEALRLENRNRGKGSWSTIRILFYLIILTIIVFIGLGKPNLVKNFETVIGALGGLGVIIPLVSKFLATGGQK